MFAKLHLLSQDVPEGGDGFRWRAHPYLRMAGAMPKGPAVFEWNARQRGDLEALWRDPATDGARDRLAKDLAMFCEKLGWTADEERLEESEENGDEYMLTISSVPPELYILPWEVIQVGATGTYLSDYASAQVRYSMPGLGPRELPTEPPVPGVLFAWSSAGGAVPHEEQAAAIKAAAEAGGVTFRELAEVDEHSLEAALDAGPPSVLHLLCHGLPGVDGEPSRLKWGASDSPSEITAPRLARMLRRHDDAIRLVVLSACSSGDGHGDPLFMGSLAQELHRKGIPGVVASRYPLSVPGSRVMTRVLYDKMLREAWSLERALRHTRQTLFRTDEEGEAHPGDAYGIQLYTHDTEWFVSDNEIEAERPVLASYPFGTAARPVPASAPPSAELTMSVESEPAMSGDELIDRLRRVSEDEGLIIEIRSVAEKGGISLVVHTTVDGAQRLLGACRSKALQVALGVIVGAVVLTKGISVALGGTISATVASAGVGVAGTGAAAGGGVGAGMGSGAGAAGMGSGGGAAAGLGSGSGAAVGSGVGAGMGSGAGAAVPAGGIAAGASKATATVIAIAGKVITSKVAIAALVGSVAVASGAVAYRAETKSSEPELAVAHSRTVEAPSGPGAESSQPYAPAPAAPPVPAAAPVPAGPTPASQTGSGSTPTSAIEHAPTSAIEHAPPPTGKPAPPAQTEPAPPNRKAPAPTMEPTPTGPSVTPTTPTTSTTTTRPAPAPTMPTTPTTTTRPAPAPTMPTTTTRPAPAPMMPTTPTTTTRPAPVSRTGSDPTRSSGSGAPTTEWTPGLMTMPGRTSTDPTRMPGPGETPIPDHAPATGPGTTTEPAPAPAHEPATPTTGPAITPMTGSATTTAATAACGNGILETGELCDDGNTEDDDGCSPTCIKDVPIEPRALGEQLISGNRNISPGKETKDSMLRYSQENLNGTVALCVNTAGTVKQSTMKISSGYDEYDRKLVAAVRKWRYRPYFFNGTPVPVCSTVEFLYKLPR